MHSVIIKSFIRILLQRYILRLEYSPFPILQNKNYYERIFVYHNEKERYSAYVNNIYYDKIKKSLCSIIDF
ncbi:hypothetical protein D7Y25_04385 [Parabacteroides goldsteinii]|nr:hypothetical protein [Parabacteroides goldsteinii]RKU72964.1 hypothetical protein DWW91_03545 [Parabacteroides sp. AF17-3]RLT86529.1 hypothetical protein D7Y25_04385 [Parabacteroides goldsteinii]